MIAEAQLQATTDPDLREKRAQELVELHGRIEWMEDTLNISEAQNEIRDFA